MGRRAPRGGCPGDGRHGARNHAGQGFSVTLPGPLGVLRELLQKKWVVQIVLSPTQPPCDPDQPYGEEPGQEEDRPSQGHSRVRS